MKVIINFIHTLVHTAEILDRETKLTLEQYDRELAKREEISKLVNL